MTTELALMIITIMYIIWVFMHCLSELALSLTEIQRAAGANELGMLFMTRSGIVGVVNLVCLCTNEGVGKVNFVCLCTGERVGLGVVKFVCLCTKTCD